MVPDKNAGTTPAPTRRQLLKAAALGVTAAAGGVAVAAPPAAEASQGGTAPMHPRPERIGASAPLAPPSVAVITLTRAGFGPWPGDVAAFNALGSTDAQRLQAWVDQQLNPAAIDDGPCDAKIAEAGFTTLNKSLGELWAQHYNNNPSDDVRYRPFRETTRLAFLRAIYSRRQLNEVLADYWHNHFNMNGDDPIGAPLFVHWDRDVIRANMLGNFRTMIEAVAKSAPMLYYLDNYTNSVSGPNENWARELFELHTMGAENYLGVLQQEDVPTDPEGRPIGYVDADVFESTRCFTGWSVANGQSGAANTGAFLYRPSWHDRFQKHVLKVLLPADQPDQVDGRTVLDTLANHPGVARYVSGRLCRRLIGDNPSQATIDAVAAVFFAQRAAPDQLKQVVRAILLSDEFRTTWGAKAKRPFEVAVSAMRAGGSQFPFVMGNSTTDSFISLYTAAGQQLFGRRSPDGFPDSQAAWSVPNPRVGGWRFTAYLVNARSSTNVYYLDVVNQTPANVRTSNQLADFWIDRVLNRTLSPEDRTAVVDFMAQGLDPDLVLPWNASVQNRVRALVGLLFWSPEFLYR